LALLLLAGCISLQHNTSESADSSGTLQTPSTPFTTSIKDLNSSLKQFPPKIRGEIQTLAEKYSIDPKYWWFDRVNNEIHIFSENIPDTNATNDLQGNKSAITRFISFLKKA